MHLGLDISSRRTGYALLSLDGQILALGDIITTKTKGRPTMFSRVDHLMATLKSALEEFDAPEYIAIEEPLDRLRRGRSNARTIAVLHRFNGMASYAIHRRYPEANLRMIPPKKARSLAGQPKKKRGVKAKAHALRWASTVVEGTPFELTGAGKDDRADALGLAYASFNST